MTRSVSTRSRRSMSLLLALGAVSSLVSASAASPPRRLLRQDPLSPHTWRRLDQGGGDDAQDDEDLSFLQLYSMKLVKCMEGNFVVDEDEGTTVNHLVLVRLCPTESCSNDTTEGCPNESNRADYAVALEDYVDAYMQDQADNWQDGDGDVDDAAQMADFGNNYAQCAQYEAENDDGNAYYVGPACTDDGLDVRLAVFSDEYCTEEATEVNFEALSNGWSLPYSDGGLISPNCMKCSEYDQDAGEDGEAEVREYCENLSGSAYLTCEDADFVSHYYWDAHTEVNRYGVDQTGCHDIHGWEAKRSPKKTAWGEVFFLLLLVAASVAGGVYYTIWWKNQKENLELIEDEEDEDGDDDEDDGDENHPEDEADVDAQVAASQAHVPMDDNGPVIGGGTFA